MDPLEAAPPETELLPPVSARARRRRKKSRSGLWLWGAGAVVLIGAGGVFGIQAWVKNYLCSPAFALKINDAAMSALHARGNLEGLSWQDSTVHASQFSAQGFESAAFRDLRVSDARAEVDVGALWDRTWKVKRISLARVEADFSPERLAAPENPMLSTAQEAPAEPEKPNWLQRWLPNRAEIGPMIVERFDFSWTNAGKSVLGQQVALTLSPNLEEKFTTISGSGGEVKMAGAAHTLTVHSLQATLRKDALQVEQFQGEIARASVKAEGTIALGPERDLSMQVNVDRAQLADWIPDDWLRRCSGTVSVDAKVLASGAGFSHFSADGKVRLKDALIQALPLLDVIAKKTRNEVFLRLQLKEAVSDFTRLPDGGWRFDKLRADAPGLLRLKGAAAADATGALNGEMLLGIVPGTLRYLAGAEQTVFLPIERAALTASERALLTSDDSGLLWTRLRLRGTLDRPAEDLSDRLAKAWFNATANEVANLSMEAAAKAAETAGGVADKLLKATPDTLLDNAPGALRQAPDLLHQGVQGGLKVLDGLLPR